MKKLKLLYVLTFFALIVSCEKEEPIDPIVDRTDGKSIPKEGSFPKGTDLSLNFDIKTQEDQMGGFAQNAMTIFDGKVWSVGGVNDYGATSSHFLWNSTNGINWATVPVSTTTSEAFSNFRIGHTLTVFQDQLWLIGGRDATDVKYTNLWHSPDGSNWSEVAPPFGPIPEHTTLVYNDRLYVIAGNATSGNTEVWSTGNGADWVQETNDAFSGRAGQKGVVFNDTMYVIGGEDIDGTKLAEVWASTNGRDWLRSDPPFTGRNAHTVTVYNDKVWAIGGQDPSARFNNEIWYSSNMTTWELYDGPRPGSDGISSHTILFYDDALWLFGGYQDDGIGGSEARGEITAITED
ncbi:kelch repeat-containing protein [Maribacter sp. 2307UL18-2]|uniref:Kelch repeat-containing protein n=1 Tax=Maribacter sp. 2307UL18-2 TaxID=3386274 RepID=UPI0039BD2DA1